MKYLFILALILGGCGSDSSVKTYYTEDNETIEVPKDENTTLEDITEDATVAVSDDGTSYIITGNGSVTFIIGDNNQIGDSDDDTTSTTISDNNNSTDTDTTTDSNNDSHDNTSTTDNNSTSETVASVTVTSWYSGEISG